MALRDRRLKSYAVQRLRLPFGKCFQTCDPPPLSLYHRHLQCTSAPDKSMHSDPTTDSDDEDTGCLSGVVRALEADHEQEAEQRLAQLDELYRFVHATVSEYKMPTCFY